MPSNGLEPQVEPHPNSCQYPLINYPDTDVKVEFPDPQEYVSAEMAVDVDSKLSKNPVQIKCDICVLEFPSLEVLDVHNCEKHEDESGSNWCHHCNIQVKTFNALKSHIESKHPEHGEKKYFCNRCDESFIFQSSLKSHKAQHKQKQKAPREKLHHRNCEICNLEFPTPKLLTRHNRKNHDSGACHHCGHKNGTLTNLKVHIDNNHPDHGEKKYFCQQCDKGFIFNVTLSHHMTWKHRENKICDICGKELAQQNLQEHMLLQHNIRPKDTTDVVCEMCGFSTPSKKKLHAHKHAVHEVTKHKSCPHCDFKSPYRQKINIHLDRNHPEMGEQQFFCETCGTGFIYKDTLTHHTTYLCKTSKSYKKSNQTYKPRKPADIPCCYCEEIFKNSYIAKIHYRNFHPNLPILFDSGISKYSCSECEDFFFTEAELYRHNNMKHGKRKQTKPDKSFAMQCDYCDEIIHGTSRVKSHYKTWHPSKPIIAEGYPKYPCIQCNEMFFIRDELDCHLHLDHGVKTEKNYCKKCKAPYKDAHKCPKDTKYTPKKSAQKYYCPQCEKSFVTKADMHSHVRAEHDKVLDFECEQCGKKLASMKRLKSHILQSHNQVTCELCHKKVATTTDLKKHKVFVHNDTQGAWLCEKCPKTVFFLKSGYEKHVKEKHS